MPPSLRWLRPCTQIHVLPKNRALATSYLHFYHACRSQNTAHTSPTLGSATPHEEVQEGNGLEPRIRFQSEEVYSPEQYPRINPQKNVIGYETFRERYGNLRRGDSRSEEEVVVRGRIWSFRTAGSKLVFIDLFQNNRIVSTNGHGLQCLINYDKVSGSCLSPAQFKDFLRTLHRGDIFSIKGYPHRTPRAELSIVATEIPQLLSRCTQPLPENIKDTETLIRNRHVDLLLNPRPSDLILLRSEITKVIRQYLSDDGHVEVQTPILADVAGGAVARPFQTSATEFSDRRITLRIAPELWLKRLIMGGFERIFEIGPSFRNEGIDLNHNPEFTTCEFYRTYTNLDELIEMTETMFLRLSKVVKTLPFATCKSLNPITVDFSSPYRRLDFIPEIEFRMGRKLPILTSSEAQATLLRFFSEKAISLPSLPTVPRLLDKLSSTYLEPQCIAPTWIVNHPECLSPLSKSFDHPDNGQRIAARAELFVNKQEFVNTYEEENSPAEQRRKFEEQLLHHEGDRESGIDESYLQALEWGLPPTGGWGCGIDRLCMLFSGSSRIADVLSFGTLRNVVSLGQPGKKS